MQKNESQASFAAGVEATSSLEVGDFATPVAPPQIQLRVLLRLLRTGSGVIC